MTIAQRLTSFSERVVLVTGATGQLGSAFVEAFSSLGATVVCADLEPKPSADNPETCPFVRLDVTSAENVADCFADLRREYKKIDILINNAGVAVFSPFENRTDAELDHVFGVNLKGSFWCIKQFAAQLPESVGPSDHGGAILNIASMFGVTAPDLRVYGDTPRRSSEIYGATKAGLIQMTRYFAVVLAPRRIRVNAISPGGILNKNLQGEAFLANYSARCPMGRLANVDEMCGAAVFLTSDAASYVTGQNLIVDGGLTAW